MTLSIAKGKDKAATKLEVCSMLQVLIDTDLFVRNEICCWLLQDLLVEKEIITYTVYIDFNNFNNFLL